MLTKKPWSRLHIDNGLASWVTIDQCWWMCSPGTNVSTSLALPPPKASTESLEEHYTHFGYPHTLVTDNVTMFMSQELQAWFKARDFIHLTEAPYHSSTNGVAEWLVQTFKKSLRKSKLPLKEAVQEFWLQDRRTPLLSGYSPSELLNGRQIHTKLDIMVSSPAHMVQGIHARGAMKSQQMEQNLYQGFHTNTKVELMLCFVSWTTEGQGPQRGACRCHQGSWFKEFLCQGLPKRICLE